MLVSLVDDSGTSIFARKEADGNAQYPDVEQLSNIGRRFLAGLLLALPDITLMLCPNVGVAISTARTPMLTTVDQLLQTPQAHRVVPSYCILGPSE